MTILSKICGDFIIPLTYFIRGDLRFYYFIKYKRNLKKSKEEIKRYQIERLKKLIKHSYNTVDYYKRLFDSSGIKPEDIRSLDDLKKIPPLTKEKILNNLNELKSKKKYALEAYSSGGSTGNSITIYKDKRFKEISRAISLRDLYSVGINPGDKSAWIWGSPFENRDLKMKVLHRLLWRINRRIIFNAAHYTEKELEVWLKQVFNKFKPDYIYGYANSIYQVAKFIEKKNMQIHQVKKIISTSEKLENRAFIENIFNCKVLNQYGSREVLSIAIEDDNYVMHSSDDYLIVELDDHNKILLTPLESYGMPLLRYEIGDTGFINKKYDKKSSTHPFNEFNISVGRFCELFRNKHNELLSMIPFSVKLGNEKLNVGEFQIIQKSLDEVEIKIVKNKNITKKNVEKLKELIKNYVECKFVKVKYVSKFPLEKSGKKIAFKCMVKDENTAN